MDIISKRKKIPFNFKSNQLRYALAYILISAAVLLFLNLYAPQIIRNIVFKSQQNAMENKAELLASSVSGCEELSDTVVAELSNRAEELNTTRVVITDINGQALFDSLSSGTVSGRYYLFPEIVDALAGKDVYYVTYLNSAIESKAAVPLMSYNNLLGVLYLMDYDSDSGMIISSLEMNLIWISLAMEALVVIISIIFSAAFSKKMNIISYSVRQMRDGNYSAKTDIRGNDEVSALGNAFNELADRLNESENVRKQFVSDASHELKTPLASIKLLADSILQNEIDETTTREFVADIGNEADRLTRLTQKLLDLTKIEQSGSETTECADLNKVVQHVLRLLRPLAESHRIKLSSNYCNCCPVEIRDDDLYQIVFNVIENGIKYNHEAGQLSVSVSSENGLAVLVVSDTGMGIPKDSIPHIFERFYRVDKARSRRTGGSGLGLSIVHDLVSKYNGEITVESELKKGTVFTVAFPLADAGR